MASHIPLAESRWLSLALVVLLAFPPAVLATPRGRVSPQKFSSHAATTTPPQELGLLFEVNTTGDGDNIGPVTGCDADAAADGDQCTLRAAIQAANANPGQHGIDIFIPASDPGCDPVTGRCVINLTKALPDLATDIEINGPGADKLTVRRNTDDFYRIFTVTTTGVVTLSGMTISNGYLERENSGGGILNSVGGTVNVNNCAITDNVASSYGGGIHNYSDGTVNVKNSLLARNSVKGAGGGCCSDAHGGGIANNYSGTVNVINSTINGNSAIAANGGGSGSGGTGKGGGIFNSSGTVNITNSTLSGNSATAPFNGEGLGGGVYNPSGTVNLKSTIVANNTAFTFGPDASGGLITHGYNILEKTAGATVVQQTTDLFGVDPKLGPLQNNGGPTQTMSLLTGSPAIDKGTSVGLTGPLSMDQRGTGFPRTVDLQSIANAAGGNGTDIGALEIQPTVQFSSAAYNVTEGAATATITVNRIGSLDQVSTVSYLATNITAIAGQDYTTTSGTLSFAANQSSKTFTVRIIEDTLDEADETLKLTLSSPTGGVALGTPNTVTLKIVDNDLPPRLSINNVAVTEGNAGAINATFSVSLSAASAETVTVKYATANATALAPADYTALPLSTLTFGPGQTSKTVTVQVKGDALDEAIETFKLLLSAPTKASILDGEGICTITDNDLTPNLRVNNPTITESNVTTTVNFAVTLSAPSGQVITVKYATQNGTALAPSDYTAKSLTTLTFQPGETTKFVPVTIAGGTLDEPTESFKLNLSAPVNAIISAGTGTCTITDNDPPPSVRVNNPPITEGNAAITVNFAVILSAPSGQTVKVNFATANGTALAPSDYTAKSLTTLTFLPGETIKLVPVIVAGDLRDEPTETFKILLSSPVNTTISAGTGTCTITDNDPTPSITISNASVTEPDSAVVNAVFSITLSAPSGQSVTVKFATANGTSSPATAGTDYTAVPLTTLTFLPGQTSKTVSIQVKGEMVKEANETFFVNLSGGVNATISDAQAVGTILNDD